MKKNILRCDSAIMVSDAPGSGTRRGRQRKRGEIIMKKSIAVMLVLLMLALSVTPASAVIEPYLTGSQLPIVLIAGDGEPIYDADNNQVFAMNGHYLFKRSEGTDDAGMWESVANVLMPFLVDGLLRDNWEPYYENLQKEIGDMFAIGALDNNGEASNGTGISNERKERNEYCRTHDLKEGKNYYALSDYQYYYDWRLDPMETAVGLHDYIQAVKAQTGCDKVPVLATCLGTNVVLAYITMYGTDDFYSLGIDAPVVNGAELISESISGKFHVDGNATVRLLNEAELIGDVEIPEIVTASITLLTRSGALGAVTDKIKATIYEKVVEGVTSALALSTFFTMPIYWSCVAPEDYDDAMQYVFGPEGSKKRTEYAGLIEKIERFHNNVSVHIPALMQQCKNDGLLLTIIAKYGFQIIPICQSSDALADQFVSVKRASFGATTSTLYDTLPDDYIAQRVAEGKGKYISPDKQIDASTCMFPDYTFFTKGAIHAGRTQAEDEILYTVLTADRQLTVDDIFYTQFMVYDNETKIMSPMTAENCHTEQWTADRETDEPTTKKARLTGFLSALFSWLLVVFKLIKTRIGK